MEHKIEPDPRDPQWWTVIVPGNAATVVQFRAKGNTCFAKPTDVPKGMSRGWIDWGGVLYFNGEFIGIIIEQRDITVTPPNRPGREVVVGRTFTVENPLKCRGEND